MRGDQLARQWRILRTIESRSHGITVAELGEQEGCHTRTIWRDLVAIQAAGKSNPRPQEAFSISLTYMSTMSPKPHLGENRA
ncbi:MAG: HTH domain-containing protein [Deltaproteobacteria bacterium]|nr:HTH domain-containing protein [Deltaproteobacteria bacterium]